MKINTIEIINLVIVLFFTLSIIRQRNVTNLLLILFCYGSLHFSFATIALATKDSATLLITLHNEGGGILAKFSALSLLGIIFVLLGRKAFDSWVIKPRAEKKVEICLVLVIAAVLCGYIFNFRYGDWLQLKNVISIEIMLILLLTGYVSLAGVRTCNRNLTDTQIMIGLVILFVADCIAFYEVFGHHSWAGTLQSSGEMVYRASSILFNPNLFAFWASLVYLVCAYGMHEYKEHRKMMLCGMVLAAIAIFFSGSRSAGYLLVGMLIIPPFLLKDRLRWVPTLVLPLTMLTIYAGARCLVALHTSSKAGWQGIALLGERFVSAPFYLINYISTLIGFPAFFPVGVPAEVAQSIEGRFWGEGIDAGWIVLYHDLGWFGMGAMLWIFFMFFLWGVRSYIRTRCVASVYALTILLSCLIIGLVMRLQVFPVWLFISVILTPCLFFWNQHDNHVSTNGSKCEY